MANRRFGKQDFVFGLVHVCFAGLIVLSICSASSAGQAKNAGATAKAPGNNALAARGQYIVNDVAMCPTCHTPRNSAGNLERNHWLDGASLWLLPARPTANWPLKAPRIGGNPPATDDEMVTLLTTGIWKDGTRLRAPMPQFRMTKDDAQAVVAYLKSLTPRATE